MLSGHLVINKLIILTIPMKVTMSVGSAVVLISLWTVVSTQFDPNFHGNRTTIVHLFEWKWLDIADECERFLQHKGYGGVQISPPNENVIVEGRPWYERYQPVSYILTTRSGDEEAFKQMTKRCNAVGIRIYADAVINHMSGQNGVGTAGSKADWDNKQYPSVPYGPQDFHSSCGIDNYHDETKVRNCELVALRDLDDGKPYVIQKITEYLNHLIDLGVAGFRIDAAKHMWPGNLKKIVDSLKNLNTAYGFVPNSKPFVYQEVIDYGGEGVKVDDYTVIGAVTEFKYHNKITNVFQGNDKLVYLNSWGTGWGFLDGAAIVFVDNHDTQREPGKLIYKDSKRYKTATAFMLAHPYGTPKVMSSFDFKSREQGPPHDDGYNLISPKINPDDTCGNGFICEHRWRQIYNMVGFRNIVKDTPLTDFWSNGDQQISFCRGQKGFAAFSQWKNLEKRLQTCLPAGKYCDIISGGLSKGKCTGKMVEVGGDGYGFVSILSSDEDGVLAIHIQSKIQ